MTSFLRFQPASEAAGFPPGSVAVLSRRHGDVLGVIYWFPPWKEHVIEPAPDTVWSSGCLEDVRAKVASLNADRRASVAARQRDREHLTDTDRTHR